jgi:uncharacterized protein YjbI with pentapeptide repeats
MANEEHLAKLREGPEAWNRWRKDHIAVFPYLNGADLTQANLYEANLIGADLTQANLDGADLIKASLSGAFLAGADLTNASLGWADLSGTDLSGTNLSRTDLSGANLDGANLSSTDLSGAGLGETVLGDTNLSGVKGLDTYRHFGPSTLDHRTVAKSGPLPLAFLRGCGLSDWQIEVTKLNLENVQSRSR